MWVDKISKRFLRRSKDEGDAPALVEQEGVYASWDAARAASSGYDAAVILERVRRSALAVKSGDGAYERDSVLFKEPAFRWQLLACVAHLGTVRRGALHVVDFGGSLASVYLQHRPFLDAWPDLAWSIVEQAAFVACGRAEFEDERLKFFETMAEAAARRPVDAVLFSSSLQYPPDPYEPLAEAVALSPAMIVIDRMPFTADDEDRVIVEQVPEEIFPASYPLWLLSERKMVTFLADRGYRVFVRYTDGIDPEGYQGIVFKPA